MRRPLRAVGLAVLLVLVIQTARAESSEPNPVKAGVAITSDRVWRGLSGTQGRPGLVGEVKWQPSNGPMLGLWAATAGDERRETSMQLLPFAGYTITRNSLNIEIAYLRHVQPVSDGSDLDFGEFNTSFGISAGRLSARLGLYHSPDFYAGGSSSYEYLLASVRLTRIAAVDVGTFAQFGASQFSSTTLEDYPDWKFGFRAGHGKWYGSAVFSRARFTRNDALIGSRDAGGRFSLLVGYSF